jgi:hypothetical protein
MLHQVLLACLPKFLVYNFVGKACQADYQGIQGNHSWLITIVIV